MSWKILTVLVIVVFSCVAVLFASCHNAARKNLIDVSQRFQDESELALGTSRMNLHTSMRELQSLRREAQDISVPPWLRDQKETLVLSIEHLEEALSAFQHQEEDQMVQAILLLSTEYLAEFKEGMGIE